MLQHLCGEEVRQVVLADDDLHIHAKVVFKAQDLDDLALGRLARRGPVGDLHIYDHALKVVPLAALCLIAQHAMLAVAVVAAVVRRILQPVRDHDVFADLLVHRRHVVGAPAVVEGPHNGRMGPPSHLDDATLGPPVAADLPQLHHHQVAMHGQADG